MTQSIASFARAAFAQTQETLDGAKLSWFSVAGENVGYLETAPRLANWMEGQFDAPNGTGARILCDATGAHLVRASGLGDISEISPLALDAQFESAGLFGSYDTQFNRWDLFDPTTQIGLRLLPNPDAYPVWEPTAPMANLLSWIMRSKGKMVMHTASLGVNGRGVLLAGPGGSGKSGTTLAGVAHGLQSVGDDYCVVSTNNGVTARPFYRAMKQDGAGLARVGIAEKIGATKANWQGKHVFDLRRLFPKAAVDLLEIRAVLLPHIARTARSNFRPATHFETLQALAPSTMLQLGGDRAATFKACAAVARQVPGFHLSLGEDPAEIAATIAAFIEKVAA